LYAEFGFQDKDTIKAYPKLVKLLDDKDIDVIKGTISALAEIAPMYYEEHGNAKNEQMIKKMALYLRSEDEDLREITIIALASLDELALPAVPEIIRVLDIELDGLKRMKKEDRYEHLVKKIFYFTTLRDIGAGSYSAIPVLKKFLALEG
ncbi:unnamed protein product, partial [marine sediment metagenome]